MFRKAVIGVALLAAAGYAIFGTRMFSYVRTGVTEIREVSQDLVPLDYQIKDFRRQIEQLDGEMEKNKRTVVKQEIAIDDRVTAIAKLEKELNRAGDDILAKRARMNELKAQVVDDQNAKLGQVKSELAVQLSMYEQRKTSLELQRKLLAEQQVQLAATKAQFDNAANLRNDLRLKVDQLATRLEMLKAQRSTSTVVEDSDTIKSIERGLDKLERSIRVEERMLSRDSVPETRRTDSSDLSPAELDARVDSLLGEPASDRNSL